MKKIVKKSKLLSLQTKDLIKGFVVAVLMAILTGVYNFIQNGNLPKNWLEWKPIVIVGIGAGISYLIKNLLTNSNDEILKKEPPINPLSHD